MADTLRPHAGYRNRLDDDAVGVSTTGPQDNCCPQRVVVPDRRELIRQLMCYAQPDTYRALIHFCVDWALYIGGFLALLFFPTLSLKLIGSLLIAAGMGRLFSFAHNAAHESLAKNRMLNRCMAFLAFTSILYNYRLWCYEHHVLHHPNCNDTKPDAYRPFSKSEFDALPRRRQWLERLYRSPLLVGYPLYYLIERHFQTKIWVPSYFPRPKRTGAWLNTAWIICYGVGLILFLMDAPRYATNLGAVEALVLGLVVPFLIFEGADAFTLYVQHTDPQIPWFNDVNLDRSGPGRPELISLNLVVPRWFGWYSHETYSHPVHHLIPGIPFFNAYNAQQELNRLLGPSAVVRRATLTWFLDTTRRCKLYDWEKKQWLDFRGSPTTPRWEWRSSPGYRPVVPQ